MPTDPFMEHSAHRPADASGLRAPSIPVLARLLIVFWISGATARAVTVFAAASMADGLKDVASHYELQGGEKPDFNFAGSNVLARQIAAGAPADLFVSADDLQMDRVEKAGLVVAGTRQALLGNSLVVVVASDRGAWIPTPSALTNSTVRRVALGDPKAVPAGVYAKRALECLHLWPGIKSKIVPTENVRAAMAAVESGNVEAGIVYRTDVAASKKVKIACEIQAGCAPKIVYPVALLKEAPDPAEAAKFLAFLRSKKAAEVFRSHGFTVLDSKP
jgi:molybdate transport system substrate-binding protein